jgi:hypothetical protein
MIWKPMLIGFGFWVAVMLTALVAKGQTYEIKDVCPIITVETPIRVSDGYSSQDVYAAKYLTRLWDEWVDSCWADSTLVNYPLGRATCGQEFCTHTVYPPHPQAMEVRWTHRDPNDLKGFMEFLRRRTK